MKTVITQEAAVAMIPDGATIMIGGFFGVGSPHRLIQGLVTAGRKDLSIIANDTAFPGIGIGKLIAARLVKPLVASHIGANPETQRQMIAGELHVELVPQGTLAERIRAGGFGLGGVLTRTGLGTLVEQGKKDGRDRRRDLAAGEAVAGRFRLVRSKQADTFGNLTYEFTAQNFNPVMAMAARTVIAEAEEIVPVGTHPARCGADSRRAGGLPPGESAMNRLAKEIIARRVAHEISPGALVNLGIGLPTHVAAFLPPGITVFFQTENGLAGVGPRPLPGMENPNLVDAGGGFITAIPGAASFDSTFSFGLIRGGHLDLTVWAVTSRCAGTPGQLDDPDTVPGMGGAMDLVTGTRDRRHDPQRQRFGEDRRGMHPRSLDSTGEPGGHRPGGHRAHAGRPRTAGDSRR